MNSTEMQRRLLEEPDFIASKRFDFSLTKLLERYPDGAPSKVIAQALMLTEDQLEDLETAIVLKIREQMKVTVDD